MNERERLEGFRAVGLACAALEAVRKAEAPVVYKTYHAEGCRRVWGRYDMECRRCQELKGGAPARKGWGSYR
jgi:hypothetical protein